MVDYTSPISAGRAPFFFFMLGMEFLSFKLSASNAGKIEAPSNVVSTKNHFRPIYEAGLTCSASVLPLY